MADPLLVLQIQELKSRLKDLTTEETEHLASFIRKYLVEIVSQNGGHLSSNLGVVELIIALYQQFSFPEDTLLFDVSHQSYVHKILSDRLEVFHTLRTKGGISGFTDYQESIYDLVHVAHAGTAISSAMGIHLAKQKMGYQTFTIVIVGDASMANGVSFEALNNIPSLSLQRLIIILNDNQMSISQAVGAFSQMLNKLIIHPVYNRSKKRLKRLVYSLFGKNMNRVVGNFLARIKNFFLQNYFENFDLRYIGPIDGHNLRDLKSLLDRLIQSSSRFGKPLLIHIMTQKGRGYSPAETRPDQTHGVAPKKLLESSPLERTYSQIFQQTLLSMKEQYSNIVAITAAMTQGTSLETFAKQYPDSFFDVGIAESHAVVFASMLNYQNAYKPYVAIYSTFFQRAIDQIFQDVSLQQHAPVFVLDRAGLVGEDGSTHHGLYDITLLKVFPRLVLCSPISAEELRSILEWSYHQQKPVVIRFPKAYAYSYNTNFSYPPVVEGKGYWFHKTPNAKAVILVYGPIMKELWDILDQIPPVHIINMLFAKPLDCSLIDEASSLELPMITLEEHSLIGGIGESIRSYMSQSGSHPPVYSLGVGDQFIQHARREEQLIEVGLSKSGLIESITHFIQENS